MRTGISITITRSVRGRLEAITRDRNTSQKHAWRAAIILSSADGVGTNEINAPDRQVEDLRLALAGTVAATCSATAIKSSCASSFPRPPFSMSLPAPPRKSSAKFDPTMTSSQP